MRTARRNWVTWCDGRTEYGYYRENGVVYANENHKPAPREIAELADRCGPLDSFDLVIEWEATAAHEASDGITPADCDISVECRSMAIRPFSDGGFRESVLLPKDAAYRLMGHFEEKLAEVASERGSWYSDRD